MRKNKQLFLKYNDFKIDSLIVALSLMSTTISSLFAVGFGINSNANLVSLSLIFICYFIKIIKTNRLWIDIDYGSMGILFLVIGLFIASKLFQGDNCEYSFIQLLFYAIIPKLAMDLNFKTNFVLKYCVHISLITILASNSFFVYQYEDMSQAYMGNIYPIVTMLIICLFHFRYYRKEASFYTWICYVFNAYMMIRLVFVANRGALLSIIICIIVIFLYKFDDDERIKKNSIKQTLLIIVATIAVILICLYQLEIIQFFSNFFKNTFGVVPSFFIKMERYMFIGDISNGRTNINEVFYQAFKESPLWGHGMLTFRSYTNGLYPYTHNFIFQYLFDGGLLFATIPLFYAIKIVIDVLLGRIEEKQDYVMAAMLVCQCYPKLLFSTDVWQSTTIWMLITFSFHMTKKIRKNRLKTKPQKEM